MKKHFILALLAALLLTVSLACAEGTAPSNTGALKVTGTQLTDAAGEPVLLRGISTHGMAWFPQYINKECFGELKDSFGCNVIRLAMYTAENGGYCTDGDPEALKELVRKGVQYALDADMYAIVDWHILSDNDPRTYEEQAIAFFDEMSGEFAGYDHVLYEICNEPNGAAAWEDIADYASRVIPVIRANDPDCVILVGTPSWSSEIKAPAAAPLPYENIMYTVHFYAATHGQWLRNDVIAAKEAGLPVFVSEYGVCSADGNGNYNFDQADAWADMLAEQGIGSCMWNLSNKDELSAVLKADCGKTSGFAKDDLTEGGKWLASVLGGSLGEERTVTAREAPTDLLETGVKGSWIDKSNGGNAAVEWNGSSCAVTIETSGKERWHVQPSVSGISLENGRTYTVSFTITADKDIEFEAFLQKNYDPYTAYAGIGDTAGAEAKTFTFECPMDRDENNSSLVFNIGKNGDAYSVSITDITLK